MKEPLLEEQFVGFRGGRMGCFIDNVIITDKASKQIFVEKFENTRNAGELYLKILAPALVVFFILLILFQNVSMLFRIFIGISLSMLRTASSCRAIERLRAIKESRCPGKVGTVLRTG